VAGLLALLIVAGEPSPARAFCRLTSEGSTEVGAPCSTEGVALEWRRRCTVVAIEEHGAFGLPRAELEQIVLRSAAHWTSVTCDGAPVGLDVGLLAEPSRCDLAEFNEDAGNVNNVVFDSFAERDADPDAFAFTTVWHNTRSGEILDVDMEVNEDRGPYVICPEPDGCAAGTGTDLENVLTHEFGHYFGLAHTNDDPEATMIAFAAAGEIVKRTLEPDDVAGLCAIYPPGSLSTTCNDTPRGGLSLECGGEPSCCTVAPGIVPRASHAWLFAAALVAAAVRRLRRKRTLLSPRG
jgi:hypothetical protein